MRFFSDNAAPACPQVLEAIAAANRIDTAYDGDAWSKRLNAAFSALFQREVEALWVSTGTAANSLALAALCPPHGSIICHRDAHIQNDECGAPEFYTGGAKLLLGEGEGAKLTPETTPANMAASTHRPRPRRSATSPGKAAWASTSTAPASPMRWPAWAARPRT
jgi:threonine aldolase